MTFDFSDLDQFSRGTPYEALAQLRRTEPISWQPTPTPRDPDAGFWLVTRYEDVVDISKKADAFHSNSGTLLIDHPPAGAPAPWSMVKNEFCSLDGRMHRTYRQRVIPSFAPKALAAMRQEIERWAQRVVTEALAQPRFDFAEDVAVRFPVQIVLGTLLGLPEGDRERAAYWSDVISAPEDPDFRHNETAALEAVSEMYEYALGLAADRRDNPRDDFSSLLAHMTDEHGTPLGDEVFTHYFWSMILGSFDTTASTIAAGMQAMIEFPDQWQRLLDDPSLMPSAVEEMLRWASPVIYFRRTVTSDVEYRGVPMRKGQRIALCYPAANRDESVFTDPDRFDITRDPNPHVSFGHGPHFCLGARLARIEIAALFGQLVEHGVRLATTGSVVRTRSNFLNRIKHFPVQVRRVSARCTERAAAV